jgi:cation-transporting ATPase I
VRTADTMARLRDVAVVDRLRRQVSAAAGAATVAAAAAISAVGTSATATRDSAAARMKDMPEPIGGVGRGRMARRVWTGHGRAHIEVRGVHRADNAAVARQVEASLNGLRGVDWARVNEVLGRVVVAFDDGDVDVDDLVTTVQAVEEAHDLSRERFPRNRPEHPGDLEPLRRQLIAMGADAVGVALSALASTVRRERVPSELASILAMLDATPRLRRGLESMLGHQATDIGLALANAAAQGIGQGPLGLVVDAAHRGARVAEVRARRRVWNRREPELLHRPGEAPTESVEVPDRVVPLPPGPVERYADGTALAATVAAVGTYAATRDHRQALDVLAAGAPKAARLTRESYAARLARAMADRGVVPLDGHVFRRFDRIDTVIVDSTVVSARSFSIAEVRALGHRSMPDDEGQLGRRALSLLDSADPATPHRRSGWLLAPLPELARLVPDAMTGGRNGPSGVARKVRRPGGITLGLVHSGHLVAVVELVPDVDPLAGALIAAARTIGTVMIAGHGSGMAPRLGIETVVAGGSHLAKEIRRLQAEGRVVALVSGSGNAALATADCGIGVLADAAAVPWGAHLLCGPGLSQACRLLDGVAAARTVSRRGGVIALYGSVAAAILAVAGPGQGSTTRALVAVNAAAAVGMATGAVSSRLVNRRRDPLPLDETAWHALDPGAALSRLDSSWSGLSTQDASARLAALPTADGKRRLGITRATVDELINPLTPTLAAGAALSAATGSVVDAALIGSVMGANALLGGVQRVGVDRALRRLGRASAIQVRVSRDGEPVQAKADQLVAGDVIELRAGDPVPADCRILHATSLEVDESSLTGESQLVDKSPAAVSAAEVTERHSMLYDGTVVAAGEATGLVVATGERTEVGRSIAQAMSRRRPGGVQERLYRLTKLSVPAALGAGVALVGGGLLRGRQLADVLGTGVSLAVAAVPEGLPLVATLGQSAAARRLSRRQALVRDPATIETLGRVDVLCFDKTGTLTEGHIRLSRISDGVLDTAADALVDATRYVLAAGLRASPEPVTGEALPHPTDHAVVTAAQSAGVGPADGVGRWSVVADLPFESARGYHAAIGATDDGDLLSVKGAPEVVLPACRWWTRDGQRLPFDAAARATVEASIDRLARQGGRLLAVAQRHGTSRSHLDVENLSRLEFLGLLALADPVRPTAAKAIAGLREAGVRVVMVTGDHPSTAESIAAELEILNGDEVVTGAALDRLNDTELADRLAHISVFARVTPAHKVRIVEALQGAGHTVAMTGDGANDAAAIRLADVGVALGRRGTDAARDAADVVVTDDRLETIIDSIVEGRAMWTSVRDAVSVLLGGNLGEIGFTVGSGLFAPEGSPLRARQLLLVNLLTDLLPSLALAVRPPLSRDPHDLVHEGPEASLGTALAQDTAVRAGATASATAGAWIVARRLARPRRASTVALATLVGTQLGQTVAAGWRSPLVIGAGLASAAALAAVVQTPGVSHFFGCRPLGPVGWTTALVASGAGTVAALAASAAARAVTRTRSA